MFRRRTADEPIHSDGPKLAPVHHLGRRDPDGDGEVADEALNTIAGILGILGRLDDNEAERAELQAWVQHLVNRAKSPSSQVIPAGRRDWAGARTYLGRLLTDRRDRNIKALQDLRHAVSAITGTLGRAVADDRAVDKRARDELSRLRCAIEDQSPEEIRRCAMVAVDVITGALDERERSWAKRLQEVSAHARVLEGRLEVAEREGAVDPLTQLSNRRCFDTQLGDAMAAVSIHHEWSVLVLFDIDHFKRLNDDYGHVVGDAVLRTFAHVLSLSFPRQRDCVARFGGEEFAVILRGSKALDGLRLAERALARIRDISVKTADGDVHITTSAGVTEIRPDDDRDSLLKRADAALYRAKHGGRDRAVLTA
jgi:diguanylate cyclase (GGDEF)-like protein